MKFRRLPLVALTLFFTTNLLIFATYFQTAPAQAAYSEISLGTAGNYLLLAGSAITNGASASFAGDGSRVTGISPTLAAVGVGDSLIASGSTQFDDAGETATAAQNDLAVAFNFVDSLTVTNPQAVISNETLTAGVYGTESSVALAVSGTVTLDGGGDNRSIFIIRTGSALDFAASTVILLINGAQASNIYWVAGSAFTMGASSTASGNFMARSAMTIAASSIVTGAFLTQGAITLGGNVGTTHQLRIAYVAPTPTPTPTPTPELTILPIPIATPTMEPTVTPTPIATLTPSVVFPQPSLTPNPPLVSPAPLPTQSESETSEIVEVIKSDSSYLTRDDFEPYDPLKHPSRTVNTAVAAFALLSVITASATNSQGYLAQLARGGKLAAAIALGRGDRRRARKNRAPGRSVNFFTNLATKVSSLSPLASRTISDASYLRASLGWLSLLTYPTALVLGSLAASSVHFQGLPPSIAFIALLMSLGVVDAMAGFVAGALFAILVFAHGNVDDLKTALTLAGILLLSYSPGILAGVFRPLRRSIEDFHSRWERAADYLLSSILTGWVVKQIAAGLNGLSGLTLPIADHASQLGLIAALLVLIRFLAEDLVLKSYPSRINDLEPEYHERNPLQKLITIAMQVLVFTLVAQPFIGWKPELWIGMALFTLPLFFAIVTARIPKSSFIHRWLPVGLTEMLVMSAVGFALALLLKSYTLTPTRYVLVSFVLLSIPGFIVDVARLFAGGYQSTWKSSRRGFFYYRIMGLLGIGVLIYIVTKGLLV